MPICWDSLNKQQFLQCDNPGQPQTRISVEISVNVYEGQWVFPAVLHEGPDSCLGINVLVTSVLHHHPTHAMPMNSRTEAKKPVAGPGQFLPVVLEDKAQLWWRWWWWLDLVSSSTCGGMEGPAVWLGLNTGLPSPLPACSSLYPAKLGQSERDRDMVTNQSVPRNVPDYDEDHSLLESPFYYILLCLLCSLVTGRPSTSTTSTTKLVVSALCRQATSRHCLFLH